jgi:hypothetical protein
MTPRTIAILAFGLTLLAVDARAQTGVTIYQDGRVLERRVLPLAVPAGASIQRLPLGPLDPGSLFPLDSGVVITGAVYDGAQDEAAALRRAVGRKIGFLVRPASGPAETVSAEVLSVDPERFRLDDGTVLFQRPGIPVFPAEVIPPGPALALGIRSDRARQTLGLGYFSGGASWQAAYAVTLGSRSARISGQAVIGTGTLRADSAEVQLLAGNVGRAVRKEALAGAQARVQSFVAEQAAGEQRVGETHLYTVPGRMTLVPGTEVVAALFDPAVAPYERTYTVRGQIPYYGGLPQMGEETTEPVSVTYVIKRPAKSEFGDKPLPAGVARIYQPDASGRAQLVGEAAFDHTAAGQDLRLDAGTAFDLTARRLQTEYTTQREKLRTVATATYTVTIANAKDSTVTVDVLEQRAGEWSVVSSSVSAEKLSSTVTRFRVRVPARDERSITYRVRVVW